MADAEVARAIVTIVPTMEGSRSAISEQLADSLGGPALGEKMGGGLLDGLGGVLGGKLGPLLAGIVSAAAVAAVGKALLDVGAQFDEMSDKIIIGTGASGAALEGLQDVAEDLATSLPVSFSDAGQTVADLNTRLGLTGGELESLARKVTALGSFGENIDINTLTGAFTAFGIEAGDVENHLDYLWGVSQSTGVSMSELFSTLQKGAPQLTELGFSIEESANLIGLLDKNGLNASTMVNTLSKTLTNIAEPGQTAQDAFKGALDQLQGFIDAGDEAAALDLAKTLFGTKQAPAFIAAIKNGTLSLEELGNMALGAGGDIEATLQATMSWPEKFDILKNKFMLAVEPMASLLFDGLGAGLDFVMNLFDQIGATVAPILAPLVQMLQQTGAALAPIVSQMLPALDSVGGAVGGLLTSILQTLVDLAMYVIPKIQQFLEWILPFVTPVIQFIADGINKVTETFNAQITVITRVISFVQGVPGKIVGFFSSLPSRLLGIFNSAKQQAINAATSIVNFWASIPSKIIGFFTGIGARIGQAFGQIHVPLPHFSVSPPGWQIGDLLKGSIPSLSIQWYARGGIVDGATLIGAGERGRELITPIEHQQAMQPFAQAVATDLNDGGAFAEMVELLRIIAGKENTIEVDGRELSRALSPFMNSQLGNRAAFAARGVS